MTKNELRSAIVVSIAFGAALTGVTSQARGGEVPLAAKFLYSGELLKGEQALEVALQRTPKDDQIRFGLGLIKVVRSIERLSQNFYLFGVKEPKNQMLFMRVPVPENPDPATINYVLFRRGVDDLIRDLNAAEAVLAGITNDEVKLPIKLAEIRLDLNGDGKADDKFLDVLRKMSTTPFGFLEKNPEFMVTFDRGDVAWLRAYCHLLAGIFDFALAFDFERWFNASADVIFAKPQKRFTDEEKHALWGVMPGTIYLSEPARWTRFRSHMLQVCALNRETWKFIRAETDDDHEWLPNPRQAGVFGMPVRTEMINQWLKMIDEMESMFEGKKLIPTAGIVRNTDKNLNLKLLLEAPPNQFDVDTLFSNGPDSRYLEKGPVVNVEVLFASFRMFDQSPLPYLFWFN